MARACLVCGFYFILFYLFFLAWKTNFANKESGAPQEKRKREKTMSARTGVLDRPSVLCYILCLYSLKEYMVFVHVK